MEASPGAAVRFDEARVEVQSLDADGFVELVERSRDSLFRYLRARCQSDEEAADLTASTYERAWRSRDHFRGSVTGARAWVFKIARRLTIDAARKRRSRSRSLALWPAPEPAPDPADLVLRDERDRLLAERLQSLSGLQQEVILLRFAGRLSAREIGEVIGKREEATQKLISRALGRLKEAYRDDD